MRASKTTNNQPDYYLISSLVVKSITLHWLILIFVTLVLSIMTKGPAARKYRQADMESCLLEWVMCADPYMKLDTIIESHRMTTGKEVTKKTLYMHLARHVDLGDFGGVASLKETKEAVRAHIATKKSTDSFDSVKSIYKIKAQAIHQYSDLRVFAL